ncbi:MAG: hypothetical protein JNM93_02070 [Bacteriovoracaceae bacterium]|nr:hypothetical protein [Bacteriovoracaceae bacterium]
MSGIHFYLTFNPFLNHSEEPHFTQAHEFHQLLEKDVQQNKSATAFWGKMIGQNRESNLSLEPFEKIIAENKAKSLSTHLYITDFNHLWVGKVVGVKKSLPKQARTLSFYDDKKVEIWFEIADFTLLEHSYESVAKKLSEFYIDNPYSDLKIDELSPFTTAIKYPAIIQDLAEEMYFDEQEDGSHLILQHHPAINNMASLQALKYVHAYALPEIIYNKIPHAARAEIEIAEIDILENRHHNNHRIAFSYIKAFEIILNDLIIHTLKRKGFGEEFFVDASTMPPKLYFEKAEDHYIPISHFQKSFSINQLIFFIKKGFNGTSFCMKKAFQDHKPFVDFVEGDLSTLLKNNKIIEIRGILAHGESDEISVHDATAIRYLMLGIGCRGLIPSLYQTFYHKEFREFTKVLGNYSSKDDKQASAPKLKKVV